MLKECVVLNGQIINIGPWDYQIQPVQVGIDDEGNPIYEDQITNPLPEGAVIEQRDFTYDDIRGWYETGVPKPPTAEERLKAIEDTILSLMGL